MDCMEDHLFSTGVLELLGETSPLCSIELIQYIYITGSQNTTKIYCTILFNMLYIYMFRPFFLGHRLYTLKAKALRVLYHDDNFRLFG